MKHMRNVLEAAEGQGMDGAREALNEFYELRAAMWTVDEQGIFEAPFDDATALKRVADAEDVVCRFLASGRDAQQEAIK